MGTPPRAGPHVRVLAHQLCDWRAAHTPHAALLPFMDTGGLFLTGVAPRPRMLVCAPSNAAIDELLERILKDGFKDGSGAAYRPSVVRVGAEEALNEGVRLVWVEAMVR